MNLFEEALERQEKIHDLKAQQKEALQQLQETCPHHRIAVNNDGFGLYAAVSCLDCGLETNDLPDGGWCWFGQAVLSVSVPASRFYQLRGRLHPVGAEIGGTTSV